GTDRAAWGRWHALYAACSPLGFVFFPLAAAGGSTAADEYLALAARLFHRADDAFGFHQVDQPRGALVADAQLALQQRDRGAPMLLHDLDGLVEQFVAPVGLLTLGHHFFQ